MEKQFCPYGDKCDFAHGTTDLSYDITKHPKVSKMTVFFESSNNQIVFEVVRKI